MSVRMGSEVISIQDGGGMLTSSIRGAHRRLRLFLFTMCFHLLFSISDGILYSILDYVILKGFKGTRAIRLCSLRFMHCTIEVILDELRKDNVNIDIVILSQRINYVIDRHEKLYGEMAEWLGLDGLLGVFAEMNVNSFGRAMAYLTLVYLINIPEDVKREAARLVAPVLRNVGVTRVEGGGGVSKNVFLDQMCACNMNNAN